MHKFVETINRVAMDKDLNYLFKGRYLVWHCQVCLSQGDFSTTMGVLTDNLGEKPPGAKEAAETMPVQTAPAQQPGECNAV